MAPLRNQTSVSSTRGILEKFHILKDFSFLVKFLFLKSDLFWTQIWLLPRFSPISGFYQNFNQIAPQTPLQTLNFFQTRVKSHNLPRWVPCDIKHLCSNPGGFWNNLIFWNIPVFWWNLYFSNVTYLAPKSDFYHDFPQFLAFASIATKSIPRPLYKHSKVSN